MDVLTTARPSMLGVRGRKKVAPTAHLQMLSGFLDPSNTSVRAKQVNSKQAHVPWPGAVLQADGKTWHRKVSMTSVPSLLNAKGEIENAPRLIQDLLEVDKDYYPSNLYICEMCHGTGNGLIISPEMYEQLKSITDQQELQNEYPLPLSCPNCAGKGTPPIPWGELK